MIRIRSAAERGHFDHGWLNTWHTFSFADYHDDRHMGFRALRVMNEDIVAGGGGFPMHGHRDMEIVTYVLRGELEHRDSLGNHGVIRPGVVQRMSAGTGILHSEFNASPGQACHLYQIWLLPRQRGLTPGYEERSLPSHDQAGRLVLVASPDGAEGSTTIGTDARLWAARLNRGQEVRLPVAKGRYAWLQVTRGGCLLNGLALATSDGAAISDESELQVQATSDTEFLLFDLA